MLNSFLLPKNVPDLVIPPNCDFTQTPTFIYVTTINIRINILGHKQCYKKVIRAVLSVSFQYTLATQIDHSSTHWSGDTQSYAVCVCPIKIGCKHCHEAIVAICVFNVFNDTPVIKGEQNLV